MLLERRSLGTSRRFSPNAIAILVSAAALALLLSACPSQANLKAALAPILASTDSGIYAYDGKVWSAIEMADQALARAEADEIALEARESSRGSYRVAANRSGIDIYNGSLLKMSYEVDDIEPGSSNLCCLIVDGSMNVMAGTDKGFAILYSGASSFKSQLPKAVEVHGLYLDASDYVYVASSAGLYKIGAVASLVFAEEEALCVYVDEASGELYLGTESGIRTSSNGGASWMKSLTGLAVRSIWRSTYSYPN